MDLLEQVGYRSNELEKSVAGVTQAIRAIDNCHKTVDARLSGLPMPDRLSTDGSQLECYAWAGA